MPHRVQREFSRERRQSDHAPEDVPTWQRGATPSLPFGYPALGAAPTSYMPTPTAIRGPEDMLSSPLGQHILSYEPPRDFVISPFSMYDGSSDLYDHMLHFNQAMILNVGVDRLLCKVFLASLKGPAFTCSTNSCRDLSTRLVSCGQHLFPSICARFNRRETSILYKPSSNEKMSPSVISQGDFGGLSNKLIHIVWMRSSKIFRRSFEPTTPFFHLVSLDLPVKMEELYRWANRYSTLEDNIWAASQTVMITAQSGKPATTGQLEPKGSKS